MTHDAPVALFVILTCTKSPAVWLNVLDVSLKVAAALPAATVIVTPVAVVAAEPAYISTTNDPLAGCALAVRKNRFLIVPVFGMGYARPTVSSPPIIGAM